MTANYVLLEKITVGAAGASSVSFTGIPQTGYTDLVVKFAARGDAGAISRSVYLTFNGSATSYSSRYLQGDGSAASSGTGGSTNIYAGECTASTATASTFANQELYIPNYASSNYKSVSVDSVAETNATTQYMGLQAGLWSNTAAITSIGLAPGTGNFAQYSTFYLYGVAKLGTTPAIVPYATGGDTIMTDGTYWYHTFLSSGTFTPQKSLTCDYLVVAGGGGGAGGLGGGGGAGGLRSTVTATGGGGSLETALSLGTSTYTVTIGAGGTSTGTYTATNGSNSVFSTITSTGGGASGGYGSNGSTGGSGGGGGATASGGAGTTNQGFSGAAGSNKGGGGGGAGVAGSVGVSNIGGAGGNGVSTSISGSSITYAGGGGGGTSGSGGSGGAGGSGGGGAGGDTNSANAVAGTANRGGGGGGGSSGSFDSPGANGGSGIVVIRYAV